MRAFFSLNRSRKTAQESGPRNRRLLLLLTGASLTIFATAVAQSSSIAAEPNISGDESSVETVQLREIQRERDEAFNIKNSISGGVPGRTYPVTPLERVEAIMQPNGSIRLGSFPSLTGRLGDKVAVVTGRSDYVLFTIDSALQEFTEKLVKSAQASHVAAVAMNPHTGAILAIADKSKSIDNLALHPYFPAASLFKVVTAAAALEQANLRPDSVVRFRGGNYTLNEWNYRPDARRDRRYMTITEALGKSVNPVFGQLGLKHLGGTILTRYANLFGFNKNLRFDIPVGTSNARIPIDDDYQLSRTAAGFGEVRISPVHAAALMSGVANGGLLPRPMLVDRIVTQDGDIKFRSSPEMLQRVVRADTAQTLMSMMEATTTEGTSAREFMRGKSRVLGDITVAGKTGTLSGSNPEGLNNWFIGAAPINNPEISVAVIVVDAKHSSRASHLARRMMERFFNVAPVPVPTNYSRRLPAKKPNSSYRSIKSSKKPVKSVKAVPKKSVKKPVVTAKKTAKKTVAKSTKSTKSTKSSTSKKKGK